MVWFEKPHLVATDLPSALTPTKGQLPWPLMDGDAVIENLARVISKQESRLLLDAWTSSDSHLLDEGTFCYDLLFDKAERGSAL